MNFPTAFHATTAEIAHLPLNASGQIAMEALATRGFTVYSGLKTSDVLPMTTIASSEDVREFCPNDAETRFGDTTMTREWLKGGRAAFQLRQLGSGALAGYGWTGPKASPHVPGGDTTFAVRLSPDFAGQHLATPFTLAINAGTLALYGEDLHIWLETWGSNERAVHTYLNAGAQLVATQDGQRPTLHPAVNEPDGKRRDTRLFMQFTR